MVKIVRNLTLIIGVLCCIQFKSSAKVTFKRWFEDKTFRYDYILGGDDKHLTIFPAQMKEEGTWAGNPKEVSKYLDYGTCRFQIFDSASRKRIYSQGFSPLFLEWQTTAEAKKLSKTAYQTARFPFPRYRFTIVFEKRDFNGEFQTIFTQTIDPNNYFIVKENSFQNKTTKIIDSGDPHEKIDIVFLAEGYTKQEMGKFVKDAIRLTEELFSVQPFWANREKFNVSAIHSSSEESGTDVPGENVYANTCLNSSFYTFGIDRYLTTSDMKSMHDIAAQVPYEYIYVLVNTDRYGGGGFYNFFSIVTADNDLSAEVLVHEFGHGFAGLADEYYESETAYEEYYNLNVEPREPNITTLVNFEGKWKSLVSPETPVPTPRIKKYTHQVGVFEGGGYMAKGIYSPAQDCRMKSNKSEGFCPVCQYAIQQLINSLAD